MNLFTLSSSYLGRTLTITVLINARPFGCQPFRRNARCYKSNCIQRSRKVKKQSFRKLSDASVVTSEFAQHCQDTDCITEFCPPKGAPPMNCFSIKHRAMSQGPSLTYQLANSHSMHCDNNKSLQVLLTVQIQDHL